MAENDQELEFERKLAANGHDILGTATNTATLTVNGNAAYRHGSFFEAELPVENEGAPAWQFVTTQGALSGTNVASNVTGNVFLPENPENYFYDADGNLTSDGRFANNWDAENRLTNITSLSGAATGSLVKLDMMYDYMGRRVQKIVSTNNGSWTPEYTNKFIYDGWNVVAVLDGGNNLIRSFVWGTDLSGSIQGAGGVGGLISMTILNGATAGAYFYGYDGNGNVTATVSAANGSITGQYEYGPFGELLRATGPVSGINPFRFSTKYDEDETGLVYYGYRYYNPGTARWQNRDTMPSMVDGNLCEFALNDPESVFDLLGQKPADNKPPQLPPGDISESQNVLGGTWTFYAEKTGIPINHGHLTGLTTWSGFPDPNVSVVKKGSNCYQLVSNGTKYRMSYWADDSSNGGYELGNVNAIKAGWDGYAASIASLARSCGSEECANTRKGYAIDVGQLIDALTFMQVDKREVATFNETPEEHTQEMQAESTYARLSPIVESLKKQIGTLCPAN